MYTQLILGHFFKNLIYGRLIGHSINCTVHTVYKECAMSVCSDYMLLLTQIHLTQYLFLTSLPRSAPMCPSEALAFLLWVCPVECPSLLQTISCNFPMVKMPSGMMS